MRRKDKKDKKDIAENGSDVLRPEEGLSEESAGSTENAAEAENLEDVLFESPEEKRAAELVALRKQKKQRRLVQVGTYLVCLQAACGILMIIRMLHLNVLPDKYLLILVGVLALLVLIPALLIRIRKTTASRRRLTVGMVLSVLMIIVSCIGTFAAMKAGQTISAVSIAKDGAENYTTAVVGVYVMADDPATSLEDIKQYQIGRLGTVDGKNTSLAVKYLKSKLSKDLDIRKKGSAGKLIQSLYDGNVQAVILNTGYMSLLGESADYNDFNEKTRMIAKIKVTSRNSMDKISENADSKIVKKPFVMYLSGSDTRKKTLSVGRSDVNILMVVDPVGKQVLLVNTPRDFYVANPAANGRMDKLTHCASYGLDNTLETLSNLYDVDINYYAQINFTGFEKLIDAMGGITVESDVTFDSDELTTEGYHFKVGKNKLDGKGALAFARDRHNQVDGDYARGRHQMAVIEGIIDKATSKQTILANYSDIMDSLQGMFITDLSTEEITSLIKMQLNDMADWNVQSCPVLGTDGMAVTYSMPGSELSVSYPIKSSVQQAKDAIQKVLDGETLTAADVGKDEESEDGSVSAESEEKADDKADKADKAA